MVYEQRGIASLVLAGILTSFATAQGNGGQAASTPGDGLVPEGSASFAKEFGVKDVRGQLRLYGKAGLDTSKDGDLDCREALEERDKEPQRMALSLTGGLAADMRFWGKLREVAAIEVGYDVSRTPKNRSRSNAVASAAEAQARGPQLKKTVRLAGFTIRLEKDEPKPAQPGGKKAWGDKFGPKNLLPVDVQTRFFVWLIPVMIRGNAGVGADLTYSPFLESVEDGSTSSSRIGIEGRVGGYLHGWVIAGIGSGCRYASACAGVKGELRLLDASTGLKLGWGDQGAYAQLGYRFQAAALKLKAIAYFELCIRVFRRSLRIGKSYERLLYEWGTNLIQGTVGQ